jgi:hypothetical protein
LEREVSASEDLLDAAIDANQRVVRNLSRLRADGLSVTESHP